MTCPATQVWKGCGGLDAAVIISGEYVELCGIFGVVDLADVWLFDVYGANEAVVKIGVVM